jgi:hypothetical protein
MKLVKSLFFAFLFALMLFSCDLFEINDDVLGLYYKSTFLGSDSFQLNGTIYNRNGNTISGDQIIAKIYAYEVNNWSIEGELVGNKFSININKIDNNGNSLHITENDDYYHYDTAWYIFEPYYSIPYQIIPGNEFDDGRDTKMYSLDIFLNNTESENRLYEFFGNKPTKYFSYSIDYVYIPEPIDISGTYRYRDEWGENYLSFDCDFSKPGWYKIIFDLKPIGKDKAYTTSTNTRRFKD